MKIGVRTFFRPFDSQTSHRNHLSKSPGRLPEDYVMSVEKLHK